MTDTNDKLFKKQAPGRVEKAKAAHPTAKPAPAAKKAAKK